MGATPGDIERQIADERDGVEARVLELRTRGNRAVGRYRTAMVVGGGVLAVGLATAGVVLLVRRLGRRPTLTQRLQAFGDQAVAASPLVARSESRTGESRAAGLAISILGAAARGAATALATIAVQRAVGVRRGSSPR